MNIVGFYATVCSSITAFSFTISTVGTIILENAWSPSGMNSPTWSYQLHHANVSGL